MKRIKLFLFSLVLFLLLAGTTSIRVEAYQTENVNAVTSYKLKSAKTSSNRFSINNDSYNNDTVEHANNICPEEYYEYEDYNVNVSGVLDYRSNLLDTDYYYFKIINTSFIRVSVDNQSNNDGFDFKILNYRYEYVNEETRHYLNTLYEGNYNDSYKVYEGLFEPGTYYIYLKGNNSPSNINYKIDFNVEKLANSPALDLNKLKNSYLSGVAWINDNFINYGYEKMPNNCKYYDLNFDNLKYREYAFDDLASIGSNSIPVGYYYIWDNNIHYALAVICDSLKQNIFSKLEENEKSRAELQFVIDQTENVVKIIGTIIGNPCNVITNIPVNVVTEIGLEIMNDLLDILLPKIDTEVLYITNMLSIILSTITTKYSIEKINSVNDLSTILDNPLDLVIEIELWASTYVTQNGYSNSHGYNLYETFKRNASKNNQTYLQDKIDVPGYRSVNHCSGRYYSLYSTDDLFKISGLSDVYDSYFYNQENHTHSFEYMKYNSHSHKKYCNCGYLTSEYHNYKNHNCIYCNQYTPVHDYSYSYKWINDTKHRETCSCGLTRERAHAVASGSDRCIQCGGKVKIGIIGPGLMSNIIKWYSKNGSYILPNGVIVLVDSDIKDYLHNNLKFTNKDTDEGKIM